MLSRVSAMAKRSKKSPKDETAEKISFLEKELAEKSALAEERLNQIKYLQADFENYRKGLEREKDEAIKRASEVIIRDLLPLIDDLENALKNSKEENQGLKLVFDKLMKICEKHGLKKIKALGKKFDPYHHEVIQKEISDKEEGTIIEEFQSGYMLNSKVIRPSKVKIAVKS
ncbi:MAG: nucleotide exchange factor GrpE [Candidatus Diapherotrites archaeon]